MAAGALGLAAISAQALDKTWTAAFNNNLNNNANWSPTSGYPGSTDVMIFGVKNTTPNLNVNINRAVNGINFTGTGGWAVAGVGTLTIGASGVDQTGSGLSTIASDLTLSGSSTWTVNSGTVAISGLVAGNAASGIVKSGSGTVILSGTNTYDGATTISAGTFFINGNQTASNGAVNVSNATLGGTGTIGGVTTIGANGALVAGTASGIGKLTFTTNLSLSDTSVVAMELAGTGRGTTYDAFDLGAGANLSLDGDLVLALNFTPANGTVFDLISYATTRIANFDSVIILGTAGYAGSLTDLGAGLWGGNINDKNFTFNANTGDLTVVPEPATMGLVGLGLTALLMRARRRRN